MGSLAARRSSAVAHVKSLQSRGSGGFGYQSTRDPGFARTAARVTSLLLAGDRGAEELRRGIDCLQRNPPENLKSGKWFYHRQSYTVQAMYPAGEPVRAAWYPPIREALIALRNEDGSWSGEHGTPMAIIVLGVPCRFLPIHQR